MADDDQDAESTIGTRGGALMPTDSCEMLTLTQLAERTGRTTRAVSDAVQREKKKGRTIRTAKQDGETLVSLDDFRRYCPVTTTSRRLSESASSYYSGKARR